MYLDILEYYKEKLVVQYRSKSKARATVGVATNCSVCDGLPLQFADAFKLDLAAGDQLTILGKIVGVPRNIIGLDLQHIFYRFTNYSSVAALGFRRYNSSANSYIVRRYVLNASYVLSDLELRSLIKLKIVYNTRLHTYKHIKEGLYLYFNGDIDIAVSANNMQIDYNVKQIYTNIFEAAKFLGIVPRPMGVTLNTVYV